MYIVIICAIIGGVIGIIYGIIESMIYVFRIFSGIIGTILGVVIGLMLAVVLGLFFDEKKEIHTQTYELESLQDNNSTQGSFFLGSGYINNRMMYTFYKKQGDTYKLEQINSERAVIKYTEEPPHIDVYELQPTDSLTNKFTGAGTCECDNKYVINIPKGSIQSNYQLDAQ